MSVAPTEMGMTVSEISPRRVSRHLTALTGEKSRAIPAVAEILSLRRCFEAAIDDQVFWRSGGRLLCTQAKVRELTNNENQQDRKKAHT